MTVVDTNVVSELMKRDPSAAVRRWALAGAAGELYTTSITLAEILCGIERLPDGERKELLRMTAEEVFAAFPGYVLPFDGEAARCYSSVVVSRERQGLATDAMDAQIAAICRAHNAQLATRNGKDFEGTAIKVIDPWHDA